MEAAFASVGGFSARVGPVGAVLLCGRSGVGFVRSKGGSRPKCQSDSGNGVEATPPEKKYVLPDKPVQYRDDTYLVELERPLGMVLEAGVDGVVYVDEVVSGGNAEQSGLVDVGDVLVAASLPFGPQLALCESKGIDFVESVIRNRGEQTITLEMRRAGYVNTAMSAEEEERARFALAEAKASEVFVKEYVSIQDDDDEEDDDVPSSGSPEFLEYVFGQTKRDGDSELS